MVEKFLLNKFDGREFEEKIKEILDDSQNSA